MKAIATLSTVLLVSACQSATNGSFCATYQPLGLSREAATALVQLDRDAAVSAAVNEDTYRECK